MESYGPAVCCHSHSSTTTTSINSPLTTLKKLGPHRPIFIYAGDTNLVDGLSPSLCSSGAYRVHELMEQRGETIPLHERRRRKDDDRPVNFSQIRKPRPLRPDMDKRLSSINAAHMTPPETPMSPGFVSPTGNSHTLFHNYLRAFCHWEPPTDAEENEEALLMTASIRPGDLILVHSVHANGWADGTVLTTGARGWLPTNYCETFDHPYMRNLLNAMTQFWDLIGAGEDANLSTFVRQDYIRGLIAGVRYLLEHADCLHRDAALVQRNTGVRRMRKGLLADLSTLVQLAKRLQETISEPFAGEVIHVLLDDLVAKAFRVVTRAVGFVDMLAQETAEFSLSTVDRGHKLTPSTSSDGFSIDTNASKKKELSEPIDSGKHFATHSTASYDSVPTIPEGEVLKSEDPASPRLPHSPQSVRRQSGLITHRLSMVRQEHNESATLASERLARAHDVCISHIGAFIGLHLHPRPSSELKATTDRLVTACKTMLDIVDQVASLDIHNKTSVHEARIDFQRKLDELRQSTQDVFRFSDGPDDDVVMLPDQTNHLVNVGTSLIRSVGECVMKVRKAIEQAGDFELDDPSPNDKPLRQQQAMPGASKPPAEVFLEQLSPTVYERPASRSEMPPPPPPKPPPKQKILTTTAVTDFGLPSPVGSIDTNTPITPFSANSHNSLPIPPRAAMGLSLSPRPESDALKNMNTFRAQSISPARKCSVGNSIAGSTDTIQSSMRDSGFTTVSEVSTRATTPEYGKQYGSPDLAGVSSFASLSSLRSVAAATDASGDAEASLLQKTYASELTLNKDGQITGGSLPALVEQLTTHDIAPDPQVVVCFFITFRCFTTPRDLAQALIDRFEYIEDSKTVGTPVRLRIYNVFKGWLETYWNAEADKDALGDIRFFALHKLKPVMLQAGDRLVNLTRKVATVYQTGNSTGPLVSGVGKITMSIGPQNEQYDAPEPIVSKSQLTSLRNAAAGGTAPSVLDFDPLELARQLTILASKIFCEIHSEELLSLEWNNKNTVRARNVRSMCILNTDLAHVVGDTILAPDDAKKRALVIKHWSKVASRCLELNNYDCLVAIMCSLNSSVVQRLKRTWEVVSKRTQARLDELNAVVDFSRNQASLRRRLETPVAPCLPFLGVYLTDLTFVDAGNPKLRELPGTVSDSGEPISVINFDKHMRMAKIVTHVQKFQVPYNLQPVQEMQTWMQSHLERMREGHAQMVGNFHRRSLIIEPKRDYSRPPKIPEVLRPRANAENNDMSDGRPKTAGSVKPHGQFEFLLKTNFNLKGRSDVPPPLPSPIPDTPDGE